MPPCPTTVPGKTECLNATWWNALSALSTATGAPLIFGVNIHPPLSGDSPPKAPFNATNARALLSAAKAAGQPLFGLELCVARPALRALAARRRPPPSLASRAHPLPAGATSKTRL